MNTRELGISWANLCLLSGLVISSYILLFKGHAISLHICVSFKTQEGGWVGPFLKENLCLTISTHLGLSHIGLPSQIEKFITSINKLIRFYPFGYLGKTLCYISDVYIVKFQMVHETYSKEPQKSTSNQYALYCFDIIVLEYVSNIHTIFLKKDEIQYLTVLPVLWMICLTCAHATNQFHRDD